MWKWMEKLAGCQKPILNIWETLQFESIMQAFKTIEILTKSMHDNLKQSHVLQIFSFMEKLK